MSDSPEAKALRDVFAVLTPDLSITPKPVGLDLYAELDTDFDGFQGCTLISRHTFSEAWPAWEMHPAGDEMVLLLEGDTEFVLRRDGADQRVRISTPGSYVIVPCGIWHTARPIVPTTMLFITPGEGTAHADTPPDDN